MLKTIFTMAAIVVGVLSPVAGVSAQTPEFQPVELTEVTAAAALDAMPAIFAVARNVEDERVSGDVNGLMTGMAGLQKNTAAQEQLGFAVSGYGFASYPDWLATTQTVFSTYVYIQTADARDQAAPALDAALQQVLNDPNIPQARKDAIVAQLSNIDAVAAEGQANIPSQANQAVVLALLPLIESTLQTMEGMQ